MTMGMFLRVPLLTSQTQAQNAQGPAAESCASLKAANANMVSGVYYVKVGSSAANVYCLVTVAATVSLGMCLLVRAHSATAVQGICHTH